MNELVTGTINTYQTLNWGAATHKGKIREKNEDSFVIEPETGLFLLSDGMGGHRGGELASKIVTEDLPVMIETGLDKRKSSNPRTIKALIKNCIITQSKQLFLEADSESGFTDMGATVAVVLIRKGRAYVANLGDSRIYRLRKEKLSLLSKDHSVVSELLDKGEIHPEEADRHPEQGLITRYVGMGENASPYIRSFKLHPGDRLLLCTDGLTDMLDDNRILKILTGSAQPQSAAENLVKNAIEAGGLDNITSIVIDWVA